MSELPKKVLFITPYSDISGSGVTLLNLLKAMRRELIKPIVVLPEEGFLVRRLQEMKIPVKVVPLNRLEKNPLKIIALVLGLPRILLLLHRIQEQGVDLIYCNTLVNIYGGLLSIISRKPCVYHVHEARDTYSSFLFNSLVWYVQRVAKRIVVVSQSTSVPFRKCGENCVVIYNGINYWEYERLDNPYSSRLHSYVKQPYTYVSLIGSIGWNKGQHLLIESFGILRDKYPDLHCLLAGKLARKMSTQRYYKQLKYKVQSYGLEKRVHYLGVQENVKELLAASSVLVLPSYSESHPLVILEAMAAGVPVIATNVGGIPEIISHEKNGLLIPLDDPNSLAREIARLLEDAEFRGQLIQNAKRTVREKFSLDKMARTIESVLLDL